MVTQRSSRQQQAAALRVQERRDEAAQDETRRYRNHERRINAAAQYIAALNAFRRAVNDFDRNDSESVGKATTAARASVDAGALVELYFSKSVQERSEAASAIVADMHTRRRGGRDLGDRDNAAKTTKADISADGPIVGSRVLLSMHHSACRPSGITPPMGASR
jgi:hypothetical protein